MIKSLFILLLIPFALRAFEPQPVTPYPVVGVHSIPFYDDFQKVQRELLVWYPVDDTTTGSPSKNPWDVFNVAVDAPPAAVKTKMPIIVLSHGYTGNPHQMSWLICGLVHHHFVVIGIQHRDLIDGRAHANHWQRAIDVKTMLSQFLANPFAKITDPTKIGIAGFSLGGTTAIWVSGGRSSKLDTLIPGPEFASPADYTRADEALPSLNKGMMAKDWTDARIKAAFIMAPAWAWLFDEESLHNVKIPVYLIASAADQVLVTKSNAGFFARNIPNATYREIPGKGTHYIFISSYNPEQRKLADPSGQLNFLFEDDVTVDRNWIQSQVVEEAVNFFNASLTPSSEKNL